MFAVIVGGQISPDLARTRNMLLLFETAAGFALFKVLKEGKLQETEVSNTIPATLSKGRSYTFETLLVLIHLLLPASELVGRF